MKNTLNGINNRLDNAEEKTTESEASQQKPSKKIKKKKVSYQWDVGQLQVVK